MTARPRPFAMLYNVATRYEVGLYQHGQLIDVLTFTARHTKAALLSIARDNGARLCAMLTETELDQEYRWDARAGRLSFGSVAVAFTGATEYQRASAIAAAA